MAIQFKEEGHLYESIDDANITWLSVTSFIGKFKPKFDRDGQAIKSAKNKRSKWYGMTPKEIIAAWDGETKRAIDLGNFYHNQREDDMLGLNTIGRHGVEVPIIKPIVSDKGFTNWEGITNKMFRPLNHLDDCNLNHYNLQLSIYAYIIKKHNPKLKIGKLTIQHVKFKQVGEDKFGYPINEHVNGEPVLENIKIYELPYLKDEVNSLMMWLKDKK